MPTCQSTIQQGVRKGEACQNETDGMYCSKHIRQAIIEKAAKDNNRLCDIARGCYTVLEDHQTKCIHCLHKARIHERKRNDQKRQDPTLCLDCGTKLTEATRAKGKHDKSLRRCVPCYEKLLKYESQRTPRERIYKAEVFTNKHVIWNHYVKGASKRRIDFAITKSHFNDLISKSCFYCDYKKDGEVNGIDRMDNNKGYTEENCVSCCQTCNFLKGAQHPQEFIDKLFAIHRFITVKQPILPELIEKWNTTYLSKSKSLYKSYIKSATSRNIEFDISEEKFLDLVKQSCYLCGLSVSETNNNGIDRFNNSKGYTLDNCRPCCGHCNLMKKDNSYESIIEKAGAVKYTELTGVFSKLTIPIRTSKVEPRTKVEEGTTLQTQESEPFEYKPLNEVIVPKEDTSIDLLEKRITLPPKQWKSKQIYEAIQKRSENDYKTFCEENNTVQPDWMEQWSAFILSVKGKNFSESEPLIKTFVENLRRIRHNQLCAKPDLIERDDRLIWPSHMVVRAFLEGKLDAFKAFTEASTNESPENPKWTKRWNEFVKSLETHPKDELQQLCSKFMTAQRTKKYRKSKI